MSDTCVVNQQTESPVCWGADQIGQAIGLTQRQAFLLLQQGKIVSARKIGKKWVAGRDALRREFGIGGGHV
jgi:hypothetical protein